MISLEAYGKRNMERKMNIHINFGFAAQHDAGNCPADAYEKISALMEEFISYAQRYNNEKYGFSGDAIQCNIFTGDNFPSKGILDISQRNGYRMNVITSAHDTDYNSITADSVIALDIKRNNLSYTNMLTEYLVNKCDVIFLLWDGKQNYQEGNLWTMLQLCKQRSIPYYLVNMEKLDEISFSPDSYFVPYSSENVAGYVAELYDYEVEEDDKNKKIFLSGLWVALYKRFINKYKLKAKNIPFEEDRILSGEFSSCNQKSARNHKMLVQFFEYYDQKAISAVAIYQASIYFRSILPFLTTVFIAIGFYAETVLGFLLGKTAMFGMDVWAVLAGIGFLIHALLNLYANRMAKNSGVANLSKKYVEARFLAEYLRVLIHSEMYEIQIDNIDMHNPLVEKYVLAKLHHIIRQQESVSYVQRSEQMKEAADNFEQLIRDQKTYHERCVNRYHLIVERLNKFASAIYMVGVAVVILRGVLQFILPFAANTPYFTQTLHEISLYSFTRSFANMLALVLPAWASYFSAKLTMNNYAWLQDNSVKMKSGFEKIERKLNEIRRRENSSYQSISDIANDIMKLSLDDYTNWYFRTKSQSFTRL